MSIILYLSLPAIYISFIHKAIIPRALISAAATIPFVVTLDYVAFFNHAWSVPTIFTFRILTLIPIEDFLFTFFAVYAIVAAFHYFLNPGNTISVRRGNIFVAAAVACILLVVFAFLYTHSRYAFTLPYFYAWLTLCVFVIPSSLVMRYRPAYRWPLLRAMPYAFVLMLTYELTALQLGFWSFPSSEYLYMVQIGRLRFPLEEMLTWMVLFVPGVIGYTEWICGSAQGRSGSPPLTNPVGMLH